MSSSGNKSGLGQNSSNADNGGARRLPPADAKRDAASDSASDDEAVDAQDTGSAADHKPAKELPPPKVTLGDTLNMKRVLDEAVVKAFEDHSPFREDTRWGNLKLLIMAVACAAALVAQFYPLPFPANRALLGVCVVLYFALSGVLQYMVSFVDGDAVYSSKPLALPMPQLAGKAGAAGEDGAGGKPMVAVLRTTLPKASAVYSCTLEYPAGVQVATMSRNVGAYFASTGFLVPCAVDADMAELLRPFAEKWRAHAKQAGTGKDANKAAAAAKGQAAPAAKAPAAGGAKPANKKA